METLNTTKARTMTATSPLHDTLAQVFVKARAAMIPHERKAADARLVAWFDGIENTITAMTGPLLAPMLEHPDVPDEVKNLIRAGAAPEQANELSVILVIVSALIFPLVQGFLAPAARAAENAGWSIPGNDVMPLSPAEIATAILKGVLPPDLDAHEEAAKWGLSPDRMDLLANIAGQAIGIEQAILLWRRGDIDDAELARVVHYSNVRSDFLPDIEKLRYLPVSAAEGVAGYLKGHLTEPDAQVVLAHAGIDPVNLNWLRDTAGRPPGVMEMLTLLNRGEALDSDVAAAVAQSDINSDWLPFIEKLRVHYPPLFQVLRAVTAGHMTDERATTILTYEGYTPEDVASLVQAAHTSTSGTAKDVSAAQTVRMYEANFIDRATAQAKLEKLKYDAGTATLLLDFADDSREEKLKAAALARVHSRYVAYKIDDNEAVNAMNADGIPSAAAALALQYWRLERGINTHSLTPAAIVGAYRRGQISPLETKTRLLAAGVVASDLAIVVADGWPPTKPDPTAVAAVLNA